MDLPQVRVEPQIITDKVFSGKKGANIFETDRGFLCKRYFNWWF